MLEILVKVGIMNRALSQRKSEGVESRIGGRKWGKMDRLDIPKGMYYYQSVVNNAALNIEVHMHF